MSKNLFAPPWLPSELVRRIDDTEFAVVPESARRALEQESDALGVHLVAYRPERHVSAGRLQLCDCIEVAEIGPEAIRRLNRLEATLGLVLVAYARPPKLRRDRG